MRTIMISILAAALLAAVPSAFAGEPDQVSSNTPLYQIVPGKDYGVVLTFGDGFWHGQCYNTLPESVTGIVQNLGHVCGFDHNKPTGAPDPSLLGDLYVGDNPINPDELAEKFGHREQEIYRNDGNQVGDLTLLPPENSQEEGGTVLRQVYHGSFSVVPRQRLGACDAGQKCTLSFVYSTRLFGVAHEHGPIKYFLAVTVTRDSRPSWNEVLVASR